MGLLRYNLVETSEKTFRIAQIKICDWKKRSKINIPGLSLWGYLKEWYVLLQRLWLLRVGNQEVTHLGRLWQYLVPWWQEPSDESAVAGLPFPPQRNATYW